MSSVAGQSLKRANNDSENNHWLEQTDIFVCHSGAQKDFSHQLWVDITAQHRHAFIDIESIPRATNFPQVIFNAVAECHVVILVLSEEFFSRSIWPMLELQAALHAKSSGKNPRLKLLPLFFQISTEDMKEPDNERRWLRIWQKWAATDDRVNIKECRKAIQILRSYSGLVFRQGMGEVEYRRSIVEAICEIVPPSFSADLTHVQGVERMFQEMMDKLGQLPPKETRLAIGTRILAAYGGVGLVKLLYA
ncbi:hypothetical protein SUGI_0242520 [Cryptomeria japonica]|nr:hypothetical protein SUGI_0242520 [Cryptomeria japonica]